MSYDNITNYSFAICKNEMKSKRTIWVYGKVCDFHMSYNVFFENNIEKFTQIVYEKWYMHELKFMRINRFNRMQSNWCWCRFEDLIYIFSGKIKPRKLKSRPVLIVVGSYFIHSILFILISSHQLMFYEINLIKLFHPHNFVF